MKNDVSNIEYCKDCVNNKKGKCVAAGRRQVWIDHYLTSAMQGMCFMKCMDFEGAVNEMTKL